MTITISDEKYTKLQDWADQMVNQHHRHTAYPLYVVYETERIPVDEDYMYGDPLSYEDTDDDTGEKVTRHYVENSRFVDVFLTEDAAKRAIERRKHHFYKPYIYRESAYWNLELQFLVDLLLELAGKGEQAWHR